MFSFPPPSIAERLAEERRHDLVKAARKSPDGMLPPGRGRRSLGWARALGAYMQRARRDLVRPLNIGAGQAPTGQIATSHPGAAHRRLVERTSAAIAIAQRARHPHG
jgi:hypothetical protein